MGRISKFENYVLQDEREGKVVPQKQELKKKKKARVGFYSQKKGCSQAIKKKKKVPPHLRSQHGKLGLGICILLA